MKEWFTLNELRATDLPEMSESLMQRLATLFGEMPSNLARCRRGTFDAEYHVQCLPETLRLKLREQEYASIKDRIRKLGLRPAVDQTSHRDAAYSAQNEERGA